MGEIIISVIVPIYKVEDYINKCVDSILGQSYQNLEVFLVDDGSPDRCGEICDEYAKQDKRINVIHKKNGGLSDARNAAIDVASGDYLMFVDSDDWIERDTCEKIVNHICIFNADIVVFGIRFVYESGKKDTFFNSKSCKMIDSSTGIDHIINYSGGIGNYAWNKIYKKNLFQKIRYPKGKVYEDSGTTYKLFHEAEKIYVTNDILYNYFIRKGSISDDKYKPQGFMDRMELWTERLEFLKTHYPEHVNAQMALMVGEMQIGLIKIRNTEYHDKLRKYVRDFYKKYKPDIKQLSGYNRKIWLYQHSRVVFNLYVRFMM